MKTDSVIYEVNESNQNDFHFPVSLDDEPVVMYQGRPLTGTVRTFDLDSKAIASEVNFVNGMPHGRVRFFGQGTVLEESWYDQGKVRVSKTFYNCGSLKTHKVFDRRQDLKSLKSYYPDGSLSAEIEYVDGYFLGRSFYETGLLREQWVKVGDRYHGRRRCYYHHGGLKLETQYDRGLKHGLEREYDREGRLLREVLFEKGLKIRSYDGVIESFNSEE